MKKIFFLIALSAFLCFDCSNSKKVNTESEIAETTPNIPKAIASADWSTFGKSKSIAINNVVIEGDIMKLSVAYSGGCKEHSFKLVGRQAISKSLPPQRNIKLFHYNNGDDCREFIEDELVFDISNLAYNSEEIVLRLENYDTGISYQPTP